MAGPAASAMRSRRAALGVPERRRRRQKMAQGRQEPVGRGFVRVVSGAADLDQVRIGEPVCDGPVVVWRDGLVLASPGQQDGQVGELLEVLGGAYGLAPPGDDGARRTDEGAPLTGVDEPVQSFGHRPGVRAASRLGRTDDTVVRSLSLKDSGTCASRRRRFGAGQGGGAQHRCQLWTEAAAADQDEPVARWETGTRTAARCHHPGCGRRPSPMSGRGRRAGRAARSPAHRGSNPRPARAIHHGREGRGR